MRLPQVLKTLAVHSLLLWMVTPLLAQQLAATGSTNPLRLVRRYDRPRLATHSQANIAPRSLAYRGVNPAVRTNGLMRAGVLNRLAQQQRSVGSTNASNLDVPLQQLPLQRSTGAIDSDMAHAAYSRAFNKRFENRTLANGAANVQELRSRVSRTGVDPRTLNARLGKPVRLPGGAAAAARMGSARVNHR